MMKQVHVYIHHDHDKPPGFWERVAQWIAAVLSLIVGAFLLWGAYMWFLVLVEFLILIGG